MNQVEMIEVDKLKSYVKRSRAHSEEQVDQVIASIQEFGFTNPVLVDTNNLIIAGHCRVEAAGKLGMTKVPCLYLEDLNEDQVRAYVIADNKLAENASWNMDVLRLEIEGLKVAGFDLELLGFEKSEISAMLKFIEPTQGQTDPDAIPDPPLEPIVKKGDLWRLGNHRLYCGDSTIGQSARALFGTTMADMVFTDPPYNVNYQGGTKQKLSIKNDNMKPAEFAAFLRNAFAVAGSVVSPGGAIYVCYSDSESINFRNSLTSSGWLVKSCLIWVKNHFKLGRMDYHMRHEPIIYGWKDGAAHKWYGNRKQSTVNEEMPGLEISENDDGGYRLNFSDGTRSCELLVPSYEMVGSSGAFDTTIWKVAKPAKSPDHPTTKPVEIPRRAIENSSKNGDIVYEPFMGSGSTLIACETIGRVCYGIELDTRYCDVIIKRWEQFTGEKAEIIN